MQRTHTLSLHPLTTRKPCKQLKAIFRSMGPNFHPQSHAQSRSRSGSAQQQQQLQQHQPAPGHSFASEVPALGPDPRNHSMSDHQSQPVNYLTPIANSHTSPTHALPTWILFGCSSTPATATIARSHSNSLCPINPPLCPHRPHHILPRRPPLVGQCICLSFRARTFTGSHPHGA